MSTSPNRRLLGKRSVGQRYGDKHPRTVKRWVDKGVIPPPDLNINNRDYWYEDRLEEHDRQLVAERASRPKAAAWPPPK